MIIYRNWTMVTQGQISIQILIQILIYILIQILIQIPIQIRRGFMIMMWVGSVC